MVGVQEEAMYLDEGSVPFTKDSQRDETPEHEDSILVGNDGVSTNAGGHLGGALAHGDQPKFPQTSYF